jgi:hypothetical protein
VEVNDLVDNITLCNVKGCHEGIKLCISDIKHKMVSKKVLWSICWGLFVFIVIPLGVTGIKVWSQQESDSLRYASKHEVDLVKGNQTEIKVNQKHLVESLQELKDGQIESQRDVKEILNYLRGSNNGRVR